MAGANNKSLKAAGFKPAGIKVIRSTGGAGLSIRSAIGHAQQHGIAIPAKAAGQAPTGWQKAAERSGMTGWQKAAAGATTAADHAASQAAFDARRAAKAEERKTAMLAARRGQVAGALGAASKGMLAARKTRAEAVRKIAADEAARRARTEEARKRLADNATSRQVFSDADRKQWIREGVNDYKRQVSDARSRRAAAPAGTTLVHLQQVGKTPGKKAGSIKPGDTLVYNFGATAKVTSVRDHSAKFVLVTTESGGKTYTQKMGRDRLVAYDPR